MSQLQRAEDNLSITLISGNVEECFLQDEEQYIPIALSTSVTDRRASPNAKIEVLFPNGCIQHEHIMAGGPCL